MGSWFKGDEECRAAFDAKDTPRISYGIPFDEACAAHVSGDLQSKRVFVIASQSLSSQTDALDRLRKALGSKLANVHIGIKSHTPMEDLIPIIEAARAENADCLVTLGAGSVSDGAKIVRFAIANGASTMDEIRALKGEEHKRPTIPLICIPTSLSGGEYQALAATTDPSNKEKLLFEPGRDPDLIILDPELSSTTPARVWLASGVRSLDHCVETLGSLKSTDDADKWAKEGLLRLLPALVHCQQDLKDIEARHQCQLGVLEAMRAVSCGVPLGASHGIGHQLGPLGVAHGETSAVLLPDVCRFNNRHGDSQCRTRQKGVNELCHSIPECIDILKETGRNPSDIELAETLDLLFRKLEMPRTLKDVGVGSDKLSQVAENSLNDVWVKTNAVSITEKSQVMEILEMVAG